MLINSLKFISFNGFNNQVFEKPGAMSEMPFGWTGFKSALGRVVFLNSAVDRSSGSGCVLLLERRLDCLLDMLLLLALLLL